jgi:Uma2 family endonuclease
MVAARKLPEFLTVDAFLAWDAPAGGLWQLVDGVPQAMAPPNSTHGLIQSEVNRLLGNHLLAKGSPCSVMTTPGVIPRVQSDTNMRIPDLGITCSPPRPGEAAIPDPILLIEILSTSNRAETWTNVWSYTTIPSVQEILVLRTAAIGADLLRRNPDGSWPDRPLVVDQGDITLESIDYTGPVAGFYRTTWLAEGSSVSL